MHWGGAAGVGWNVRGFGMSLLSKLGHSLSIALWPTHGSRKAKDSIALFSCFFLSSVYLSVYVVVCLFTCCLRANKDIYYNKLLAAHIHARPTLIPTTYHDATHGDIPFCSYCKCSGSTAAIFTRNFCFMQLFSCVFNQQPKNSRKL